MTSFMASSSHISLYKSVRYAAVAFMAILLVATQTFGSAADTALAAGKKSSVFGTVTSVPRSGRLDVTTREGKLTLHFDDKTKIRGTNKKKNFRFLDVKKGMSVVGYYMTDGDELLAKNLTFVPRKSKKAVRHIVGVVLKKKGKDITVKTANGDQVQFSAPEEVETDEAGEGSMVAVAVEEDEDSGELEATALVTAQSTIEKLSQSITNEIGLAQQQLLKVRVSETAAVHLNRLYETLDEIEADAQARISAAYTEYEAAYEATLSESGIESVTMDVVGQIVSVSGTGLIVRSSADSTDWNLEFADGLTVHLADGTTGDILAVRSGMTVEAVVIPATADNGPIVTSITILPTPEVVIVVPADSSTDTITGTIILVDDATSETETVIVVTQPDGTDSATSVTPETVVIVDGEEVSAEDLEAGQEVEVTLEDDGFTAEEIQAAPPTETDPVPTTTAIPAATTTPITTPIEYLLIGKIRSLVAGEVILDEVSLFMGEGSPVLDPSSVGQEVQLRVVVDGSGRMTVVGIQE